jgi:hypothetical protein
MDPKTEGAKSDPKVIKLGDEEFEEIPRRAYVASDALVKAWERLGKPKNPFTRAGKELVDAIIKVWKESYPKEANEWYAMRTEYQRAELPISTQVKRKTGRSLASYPYPIYTMMRKLFPNFKPAERKNAIKMVKRWPMFRMANKV